MADYDSYEEDAPVRKRGIPGWVWFCGGGCALVLVALVVVAILAGKLFKEGTDAGLQWERLASLIEVDEERPHLSMSFGFSLGVDSYILEDDRGYQLVVQDPRRAATDELDELFGPDFTGGEGVFGVGRVEMTQAGEVEVQGRRLRVQRFRQSGGTMWQAETTDSHAAFVEVPSAMTGRVLIFMLARQRGTQEPLRDDEIRDVLAPFHIGPERGERPMDEEPR